MESTATTISSFILWYFIAHVRAPLEVAQVCRAFLSIGIMYHATHNAHIYNASSEIPVVHVWMWIFEIHFVPVPDISF